MKQGQPRGGAPQHDWDSAQKFTEKDYGELDGRTVENLRGQEIGEVEEIVTDWDDSKCYAVIAVGGTLSIGEKKVAIELNQLRCGGKDENVVPRSEKGGSQLEGMPADDESQYRPVR